MINGPTNHRPISLSILDRLLRRWAWCHSGSRAVPNTYSSCDNGIDFSGVFVSKHHQVSVQGADPLKPQANIASRGEIQEFRGRIISTWSPINQRNVNLHGAENDAQGQFSSCFSPHGNCRVLFTHPSEAKQWRYVQSSQQMFRVQCCSSVICSRYYMLYLFVIVLLSLFIILLLIAFPEINY